MTVRLAQTAAARQRALEVLAEQSDSGIPVIPERIAAEFPLPLPISSSSGFPPRVYGALYKIGNDFSIVLSAECPTEGHRRFTLSHELGHFFLDGHLEELFDRGAQVHLSDTDHFRGLRKPWFEAEADAFAAELLVPSPRAAKLLQRTQQGLESVHAIANTFDCSLSCAGIRYTELTSEPAAVVLSHEGAVEWVALSESMREHWWARRTMKGEWAPPRSASAALARNPGRILNSEVVSAEGLLIEWFEKGPATPITEEAIGLGSYGRVLTVLTCASLPSPDELRYEEERRARKETDWREARGWQWDSYDSVDDDEY